MKNSHYYGSDLNRFIDEQCRHDMTCINIDCLIFDDKLKKMLIIESKHNEEHISYRQEQALNLLRQHSKQDDWNIEYYIIRGDYPYKDGATIQDMNTGQWKQVTQEELKRLLELKSPY